MKVGYSRSSYFWLLPPVFAIPSAKGALMRPAAAIRGKHDSLSELRWFSSAHSQVTLLSLPTFCDTERRRQ
ncbi:MAG: hypothetical protein KAH24_03320, partial [Holophagae bacterium]|nr:hypothetical protein [Holophagae bacterium]